MSSRIGQSSRDLGEQANQMNQALQQFLGQGTRFQSLMNSLSELGKTYNDKCQGISQVQGQITLSDTITSICSGNDFSAEKLQQVSEQFQLLITLTETLSDAQMFKKVVDVIPEQNKQLQVLEQSISSLGGKLAALKEKNLALESLEKKEKETNERLKATQLK